MEIHQILSEMPVHLLITHRSCQLETLISMLENALSTLGHL